MVAAIPANAISMRAADACMDDDIKSVQLRRAENPAVEPVIALGSGQQVRLTFDDLSGMNRRFSYNIILCDADWNDSPLPASDYVAGFAEDNISDYKESFGTAAKYTHYELLIPNDNTQLLLSGNYKIQVMDSNAPNKIVLQKCFMAAEHTLPFQTACSVNLMPSAEYRPCMQQLNIKVDYGDVKVQNPRSDIKVRIMQNGHSMPLPPPDAVFFSPTGVDYSFYDRNLYPGGAEYRQFDISSFEYLTLRVRHIAMNDAGNEYQALLEDDGIVNQHFTYSDYNGGYVVHSARYPDNSGTESDYARVHFILHSKRAFDGSAYIFGELTNWELAPQYEMRYNPQQQAYECSLLLKQGQYDYRYLMLGNGGQPDFAAIEHCSSETENSYSIYVYYRAMSDRHDRLVGVNFVNTKK